MKLIKKILTILILLFNVIVRRRHYKLKFISEETDIGKLWYYHFPLWGFDKHNLLMVSGADKLCEYYSEDGKTATVEIVASRKDLHYGYKYDHYIGDKQNGSLMDKLLYGRNYTEDISAWKKSGSHAKSRHFWICPVTLFVLGRYPKHIYIKRQ